MKTPAPQKLPSGSYHIRLRLGGETIYITKPTARECVREAELVKAEYRAEKRTISKPPDLTLGQLMQQYLDKHEAVLSPSTVRGWTSYREHRFEAYQSTPVKDIHDWQAVINAEAASVSPKTVKCAWGFLAKAMRSEGLSVPSVRLPQVPIKEIPFLQPGEIKPFLAALEGNIAERAALLELQGLRRSEVLGLDWKDVDVKKDLLHIRGATVQNKDGAFVKKETNKNSSSTRTIPIMIPRLHELLEEEPNKTGAVVTIAANTMLRNIKEACAAAGVTQVGNHGLRHSFASLGYHLGISERELMQLGGWSDYMTMHKIYVRVAACDERAAQNKIAEFFKSGDENGDGIREAAK